MSKKEKIFIPIYILALLLGGLYVRSVLNSQTVEIEGQSENTDNENNNQNERFVNVDLILEYPYSSRKYEVEMKNTNSAMDLLEEVRDDQNLVFEKTLYSDHMEINSVNGQEGNWRLYLNGEDITNNMNKIFLEEDLVFTLKQD